MITPVSDGDFFIIMELLGIFIMLWNIRDNIKKLNSKKIKK